MVVGWQISESLRSDLAIDALEMAVWNRTRHGQVLDGLVHHSDRGVQYLSIRYSERLDENDIVASVGSRGDSYDNAMAEAFNSLYKWELIYPQGPWRGLDDVEFATLGYIVSDLHRDTSAEYFSVLDGHQSDDSPSEGRRTNLRALGPRHLIVVGPTDVGRTQRSGVPIEAVKRPTIGRIERSAGFSLCGATCEDVESALEASLLGHRVRVPGNSEPRSERLLLLPLSRSPRGEHQESAPQCTL